MGRRGRTSGAPITVEPRRTLRGGTLRQGGRVSRERSSGIETTIHERILLVRLYLAFLLSSLHHAASWGAILSYCSTWTLHRCAKRRASARSVSFPFSTTSSPGRLRPWTPPTRASSPRTAPPPRDRGTRPTRSAWEGGRGGGGKLGESRRTRAKANRDREEDTVWTEAIAARDVASSPLHLLRLVRLLLHPRAHGGLA